MSFKDTIIKNTLESRSEIEKQKTMYSDFYSALKIEERIIKASLKGEGCVIIEDYQGLFFHRDPENDTIIMIDASDGSICPVKDVVNDLRFVEFVQGQEKFLDFDIYRGFLGGLVIKWVDE